MSLESTDRVRQRLRDAISVRTFYPPANAAAIVSAEARLGVVFPGWLRELYLGCNGFLVAYPSAVPSIPVLISEYFIPLEGGDGLVEFTEFLRAEEWAPPWLSRAVVFGSDPGSGSCTTHFVALDGELVTWMLGDGDAFSRFDGTVYDLYRREQALWDESFA